jgi:PAS domain S-box-containing protein
MSEERKPKVLVVDDEKILRDLLHRAITSEGCEVLMATTCAEALEAIKAQPLDLLLIDKNLPDGSGLDVIATLRGHDHLTPVIVMTGYSDTASAIQAVALDVFSYQCKPLDLEALKVEVTSALEKRRMKIDLEQSAAQTRELLTEAEQRVEAYRLLFDEGPDAGFVYAIGDDGAPGSFVEVNQAACALTGFEREELLALRISDLNAGESRAGMLRRLAELREERQARYEIVISDKTGAPIPVEVTVRLVDLGGQQTAISALRPIVKL